jgi:hypothetical protein
MPTKRAIKRARADNRAGKSSSTQAGEFVPGFVEADGDHLLHRRRAMPSLADPPYPPDVIGASSATWSILHGPPR